MSLDDIMEIPQKPKGPVKAVETPRILAPYITSVYSGGRAHRVGDVFLEKDETTGIDYLAVQTYHGIIPYDSYDDKLWWD